MPGEEQSANPPISSEMAAGANSAWKDIMDDLSSIPSSPSADVASKDLHSSSIPCTVSCEEQDVWTGKSPPTGCSRKKRKLCKENGSGSRDTIGVDSASEQPSMNKKSGFVKSAASSCHVSSDDLALCFALSILL
jgi:DEAD/DEAH box helicase domain-containing protein